MFRRFALAGLTGVLVAGAGATGLMADSGDRPTTPPPGEYAGPGEGEIRTMIRGIGGGGGAGPGGMRLQDFTELTKGAKTYEGFITLHEKDQHLYAEIKPQLLEQPILAPMMIARGSANAGQPLNFGDEWVLSFRRVGDKLQLIRKNVHFTAPSGSPIDKAVKQNYSDSVLMSLPILSMSPHGGALVVDFADIYLTDFAQVGMGMLDRSRSRWFKIRAYENNVEIQVEATFTGGRFGGIHFGPNASSVIDPRGITLVLHYSLCRGSEHGYRPRMADYRVGHFLNAVTDYGNNNPDTNARRMINRWRLEKANPGAKLSPPKKQIVWYIEDNVPIEYRPYVQQGILEWNKAFEKIGFLDAIAVRWQNERDDFEPEDINYCTLRWITTGRTFAMSGLRSNPMTGEMIDGDVIFDASWIKVWKKDYAFLVGIPTPAAGKADSLSAIPLAQGEVISPILAMKQGFGLPVPPPGSRRAAAFNAALLGPNTPGSSEARPRAATPYMLDVVPDDWDPVMLHLQQRLSHNRANVCNYAAAKVSEMQFAALALAAAAEPEKDKAKDAKDKDKKEGDKDKDKDKEKAKKEEIKLPEEFLGQLIKEVVMHEVGHSLGLRHNFKASGMLSPEQINDTSITRVKGMVGSVMDYSPINVAPKGQKQGDYATTTIGPYDYWAIEYAYAAPQGDEDAELKKIAAKSSSPDLAFGTDEDVYQNDPQINRYDLTNDTLAYSKSRIALASELLKDLDQRVVKDGESWARLRVAFMACLKQLGNGSTLASEFIGGQSITRDFKGTHKARDPITPVSGDRQREALKVLVDSVLTDKSFAFSPAVLRKLISESWQDNNSFGSNDIRVYNAVAKVQNIALNHCLDPSVLDRLQNQELQSDPAAKPIKIAEVFRGLSDGIFADLAKPPAAGAPFTISTIRRNLQREYVRRLSAMVLGPKQPAFTDYDFVIFLGDYAELPADARNLARLHLDEIGQKIGGIVATKDAKIDDTTLAHLKEIQYRIDRVLKAGLNANEP